MLLYIVLIIAVVICGLVLAINLMIDKKSTYNTLKGKHVVITGGSSGIGKAAAVEAGRQGAHVTVIGRDVEKLKTAVKEITDVCSDKKEQKIQYAALDVTTDYDSIQKCLSKLESDISPIFMLVNCAGTCICGQFEEMRVEDIKMMIDLNYFGTAYPTKYVLSGMKKRNEGIIVFVSSEAALIGIYGYSAYSAAKWAVRGLAESVNMEVVGTGVRVMLSLPPDTDTPGFQVEELTKPKETKQICDSGSSLHTPEEVGVKLIHDAMNGKMYSVVGFSGSLLALLFGGTIESSTQVVTQIFTMGLLRAVFVPIVLPFYKIVRDGLKERKQAESQKTK